MVEDYLCTIDSSPQGRLDTRCALSIGSLATMDIAVIVVRGAETCPLFHATFISISDLTFSRAHRPAASFGGPETAQS